MRFVYALLLLAAYSASPATAQQFGPRTDFATGLSGPYGVTELADGRVLVTELNASRVSAFPAAGGMRTDFATGLGGPLGVAQLSDSRVLVIEINGSRASAFPATGGTRTDFATGLANPWHTHQLTDGRVLITEELGGRVSAFSAAGGTPTDFATGLSGPIGVTQLADGRILVTERSANRISAFTAAGGTRADFATGLSGPYGITQLADGRILVAESGGGRVAAFGADGTRLPDLATGLNFPTDVAQLADGTVLVSEAFASRVSAFIPITYLVVDTTADTPYVPGPATDPASSLAACTDDTADGDCSLREAIEVANAASGPDEIAFDLPGSGVRTIRPLTPLPVITEPNVVLDGYTQPGARANTSATGSTAVLLVEIDGSLAGPSNGLTLTQSNATVRGLVINRFDGDGISIQGSFSLGSPLRPVVEGTYIGTSADGTARRPNTGRGVLVQQPFTRIGTDGDGADDLAERNVISGNEGDGVEVFATFSVRIAGNRIGTTAAGTAALQNEGSGIFVDQSTDVQIGTNGDGSNDDAEANVIANNGLDGVRVGRDFGELRVSGAPDPSASILGNAIRANGGLGINLVGGEGEGTDSDVSPNDPGDFDRGPNRLQNFPVIESVTPEGTGVTAAFTLDSDEYRATYRIEFFASATADPSGFGEGARFLGAVSVQADEYGDAAGTFDATDIVGGEVLTATATIDQNTIDRTVSGTLGGGPSYGGTSEFSNAVTIGDPGADNGGVEASFEVVQRPVSEGAGSADLVIVLSDEPTGPATLTVVLVSGDPADIGGFTTATVEVGPGTTRYAVAVPITDDAVAEGNESVVFRLTGAPDAPVTPGDVDVTSLVIVDNDGERLAVTVPIVDADGDGADDGGPRFVSLPVSGVTAGELADALGATAVFRVEGDRLVAVDAGDVLVAGQPVVVDAAPGAPATLEGTRPSGTVGYALGTDPETGRVLVALGNPTTGPLALGSVTVDGGTLADVALVFDREAGAFRPVSLAGLADALGGLTLDAPAAVVLQVTPTGDAAGVTVTVAADAPAAGAGAPVDAPFAAVDGETAVVLALRPAGSTASATTGAPTEAPGDTAVLRFLDGADDGPDRFDGADVRSPLGATLAVGAERLAALSQEALTTGATLTAPLTVAVSEAGSYELALAAPLAPVDGRPVVVEVLDGGAATVLADGPFAFTATGAEGEFEGRFAVRVSLGAAVAAEPDPAGLALAVFPNPTAGPATVAVTGATGPARVSVVDALGRQVAVLHDGPVASGGERLVVGRLAPGVYVVRLQSGSGVLSRTLTVTR